ncbi:DNA-methyltransferase [Paraburkholderia caffeinilytica]|uniref:DNA-methyltransferase n=1 Tax=Paraburkholderia caffeinilytica TaxID=1761016 RepID=UPI0038B7C934
MDDRYVLHVGDCQTVLAGLPDCSIDSIVTDPPYERPGTVLHWDGHGVAFDSIMWSACLRVLKPGGHLLAFAHAQNYHHLASAVERAGFEVRDMLAWIRQGAFPVSTDVAKKFDGVLGTQSRSFAPHAGQHAKDAHQHVPVSAEAQQWAGYGTALRNCIEPILLARRPLVRPPRAKVAARPGMKGGRKGERLIANLRQYQTGALNLSACAVQGRWPANVIVEQQESWSRYFYCPKASAADRGAGNDHPTVKPVELMRWLCTLVTPAGGTVLDPFCGSGSTGVACARENMQFIGIELSAHYADIARTRLAGV